jgi:hypothetical protein
MPKSLPKALAHAENSRRPHGDEGPYRIQKTRLGEFLKTSYSSLRNLGRSLFFLFNAFCIGWLSWDQFLAVFAESMLIMFGIEGPEGMASSDCLMANQIA